MAHELTHVANRDVMVMTLAGFFATIAAYIVQFGFFFGGGGDGRRRRQPELHGPAPRLGRRLRRLVPADAGALALPRVRGRPRRGDHHRPAERARLGADEDLQRHAPDPAAGPARLPASCRRSSSSPPPGAASRASSRPTRRSRSGSRRSRASRRSSRADSPRKPVGFFDILRGKRKLKQPAPDRLFAMSTAYVTMETELHSAHDRQGGDRLPAARDRRLRADRAATWRRSCAGTGSTRPARRREPDDEFGYRWMVLRDADFEDLVVGVNAVSSAIQGGGYGDRILCAVFAFRDEKDRPLYWIYNYKRGAFYPFVPGAAASSSATTSASCG